MKTKSWATLFGICAVALLIQGTDAARADGQWKKKHPRRAEVNARLNNQQKRVDQGLANGSLKTGQAEKIQNQDAHIRNEERRDAARDGGHITKREQAKLNREENHVSREINRDEAQNKASKTSN